MRSSSEYRRIAREALKGRYFQMVGIALIAAILGGGIRITDCCSSLGLIGFLIGGYASLCLLQIYRNILDTKELDLKDLLSFTDSFLSALLLRVLCVLFICLWSLLLIIPGIIKKYSYSMSGYIMSVNPDIDPMDAISMSRELMRGYKWKLFCLKLSFLGWILLSLLTFGIGLIFLLPYMQTATVAFFDDIYFTRSELYLA